VSAESVDLVRRIYDVWSRSESAREFIAEDIEYVNPPDAVEPGIRRGRKAFAGIRDAYDDVRLEPTEFIDAGDDVVVVLADVQVRGRGSGMEIQWRHGYVWTVRDAQAVRFQWFNKPDEALVAAGITGRVTSR
jgi:ketosteroid isomerase-like protein